MSNPTIGILHPGEMGISMAAAAKNSGCTVYWASKSRSAKTRERVAKIGLEDAGTVAALCRECRIVMSVCPPHAAEDVAREVRDTGFQGMFIEANAIAPQRTIEIGQVMTQAGIAFIDGGIIGLPAWTPGTTCLYLSGPRAVEAARCFAAGPVGTAVLGPEIGKASALKMCYAANTKGAVALLAAILTAAETMGVREALFEQWRREDPALPAQVQRRIQANAPKAWRFVGEMREISRTFREAGAPGEFHVAAGEIYRRLAGFKDTREAPTLEDILAALAEGAATNETRS